MITKKTSIKTSVEINRINESILFRFGIHAKQELSIENASSGLSINTDFLVDVLNYYEGSSVFEIEKFKRYSIPVLLEFLQKSHFFYKEKKLLEIEQSVFNLMIGRFVSFNAVNLISLFYTEYKKELINHFNLEENVLFPYAMFLYNTKKNSTAENRAIELSKEYSIEKFIVDHKNSYNELDRVRESLRMFNPSKSDESALRVLLYQFKYFETDLSLHHLIEDEVLVPKLLELEGSLK